MRRLNLVMAVVMVLALAGPAAADRVTATITLGTQPEAVAVNPVTNKIYVLNSNEQSVTVIGGATNDTTLVAAGAMSCAVAVNPVTSRIYVVNLFDGTVKVITDAPAHDTKVRVAFDPLPGDTTLLARPALTGKGVNRSTPNRTAMTGVGNKVGTAQLPWGWASVTGGGTDSISWTYAWGSDSLIPGENFVCCVPLEDQAATTNNLGLGTPFAGNLEVYPLYRMAVHTGQQEATGPEVAKMRLPSIVRGVLEISSQPTANGPQPGIGLLDISGRKVMELKPGSNDVSRLVAGVYFVRAQGSGSAGRGDVHKVVLAR